MKPVADVSILAANYNNGRYLSAFIESVDNSELLPKELIIIDDGSKDDSKQILESFRYLEYLKTIYFEYNKGFTDALNAGLDIAQGKYIMRADPDDILLPNRIKVQYEYMENNPGIDILGSNVLYFNDQDGSIINSSNFPTDHDTITKRFRRGEHGVQHPSVMIKAEVYKKYRYQKIFPAEDYEIFSRMARDKYQFANIPEPLYKMRVHAGSSTSNIKLKDIKQTFLFRDQIFGTKTGKLRIWLYYKHIYYYRKFQMNKSSLKKYFYLFISATAYPSKLFKRVFI
jgi:glycosyltransferase involved in cell wall biosynthesis